MRTQMRLESGDMSLEKQQFHNFTALSCEGTDRKKQKADYRINLGIWGLIEDKNQGVEDICM